MVGAAHQKLLHSWETMRSSKSAASRRRFLQAALTTGGSAALYPALSAGRVVASPSAPAGLSQAASAGPEVRPFELDEIDRKSVV